MVKHQSDNAAGSAPRQDSSADLFSQAQAYHQQNRLAEAEALYRQILAVEPKHAQALCYLGVLAHQVGQHGAAEGLLMQSLALVPQNIDALMNLGNIYDAQKKHREAADSFRKAIALQPGVWEAYLCLALALKDLGERQEAIAVLKQAVALNPKRFEAFLNLGNLLKESGDAKAAIPYYQAAAQLLPDAFALQNALGGAYAEAEQWKEAEEAYLQSLRLNPAFHETYFNLGRLYHARKDWQQAERFYRQALEREPKMAVALLNLGILYEDTKDLQRAIESTQQAIALYPDYAEAHCNLGNHYKAQGLSEKAMECYQRALAINPDYSEARSNYLFVLHYVPGVTPQTLYDEAVKWGRLHADPIPRLSLAGHDRNPERRMRIGYVSADLRHHPVAYFLKPVFAAHNKSEVELFCYANQSDDDETTASLKAHVDHWHAVAALSDAEIAERIRQDGIDVLIDVSGHTAGNRLKVFARKPAPIQATWVGYFDTVGIKAIDYLISDQYLLPVEEEQFFVEKPLRLPDTCAVFKLPDVPVAVSPLPALSKGKVTFGCFNHLPKISMEALDLWVEILKRVPGSELYLKNKSFGDAAIQNEYRTLLEQKGISGDRLRMAGASPLLEYYAAHQDVDIALDPFPYNGGSTTIGALWMGLPVIVLKGDRLTGHMGESMVAAAGKHEFTAFSKEEYVEKAVYYATHLEELAALRASLRGQVEASALTDGLRFTRELEAALRKIWREYCANAE